MASPLFCEGLLDDLCPNVFLGIHLLQTPDFFLQFLHGLHHGGIHAAKLGAPFVKLRVTRTVFIAEIRNFDASFGFFEDGQDLAVGKPGLFRVGSPCSSTLENPTFERNYYRGYYPSTEIDAIRAASCAV